MPVHYQAEIKGDYLHVVSEGSLSSTAEMMDYIARMRSDLVQAGLCKLLVDEMKCHMHIDFDELEEVASELREPEWLVADLRVAVVSSTINIPLFQHVFDPIGNIKVFTDAEAAARWLAEG